MSILNHDLLILQQFRSDSSPRFDILDAQGQGVGVVSGTESGVRRIFLGAREFDVLDTDGSLLTHVSDVRDLWRDTYKVMRGDGSVLATIVRKMGFFSRKFSITLTSGEELTVKGDVIDREFTVVNENSGETVAQVSRERTGVIEASAWIWCEPRTPARTPNPRPTTPERRWDHLLTGQPSRSELRRSGR